MVLFHDLVSPGVSEALDYIRKKRLERDGLPHNADYGGRMARRR